jgi:cell division inhibitor SepF
MALRDTWRRSLEYFGLVEGDYIDEGEYDEMGTDPELALDETAVAPREAAPAGRGRRSRDDDIDDIFGDDEPRPRRRVQAVEDDEPPPRQIPGPRRRRRAAPEREPEPAPRRGGGNGGDFSMHMVTPRNFNDAQSIADEFKRSKPVIINLQSTDRELSKRLIDFSSGMTYALGGGMQRIAQGIFLLTPQNVDVSAEEKARILEGGFFNQS